MKIKKNCLDKEYFKKIKDYFINPWRPYYYQSKVSNPTDKINTKHFYFNHIVFSANGSNVLSVNTDGYDLLRPLLNIIECKAIILIKVNLYPRTDKILNHNTHVDNKFKHKGCLLSLNTCNGGTIIDKKFIKSEENQALFFDPSEKHNSTTCTDQHARFNININYF